MPEETTNTQTASTETAQTATTNAEQAAAATTTAEPAEKAAETVSEKTEPVKDATQEQVAKEPELTIDSYKDLNLTGYEEIADLSKADLESFKQMGLKNKLAPEALQAIANWSLDNLKAQKEAFAKIQEGWREENAKKYGDNLKNVKTNVGRVLADFDKSGTFANLLKDAGAEEHPATLEFLSAIGDVLLEKGSVNANATIQGKEMSLEDMYKTK